MSTTAMHRQRTVGRTRRPRLPLLSKALVDARLSTLVWAMAMLAVMALYLPLFPAIGGNDQMQQMLQALPPELVNALNYGQIATGTGYTQATVFGLLGFLLMTIMAVSAGAGAIGGDEESGLLELTIAHGVTRTQVVLERAAALVVRVVVLHAFVLVVLVVLKGPAELGFDAAHAAAGVLMFALLVLLNGSFALLGGAIGGRKVHGIAAGAGVAVLGYAFNALGNQNLDLEWMHAVSPYYWAYGDSPLVNGADAPAALLLLGVSAACIALAVAALHRRDIHGV
ncbi:ABC transporter permease subunit [Arthrobacter sp. JSM 101049]|uniref:ABC transporter permease subunit n=1 Tax=Arthrobacter sp. JSM 101049 TaxID=929097 RepID=UPI003568B94E